MSERFKLRYIFENKIWDVIVIDTRKNRCCLLARQNKNKIETKLVNNYDESNLLQCIGWKDINGQLIYESDIIEIENKNCTKRGIVQFDYNNLCFFARNISLYSLKRKCKVIGNIYNNPELLKTFTRYGYLKSQGGINV